MAAAAPRSAKKSRRQAPETQDPEYPARVPSAAAGEALHFESAARLKEPRTRSQESPPPPPEAGGGGGSGGVDRISGLPDAILGEIVSLLSTKEAARTQILASRWRHVWRAAPLVLDGIDLAAKNLPAGVEIVKAADVALASVVSHILSAHPGPGRRFCIPMHHLHDRPATVDAWLRSPALDNLQELDFCDFWHLLPFPPTPIPASTFRFCATLLVATFTRVEFLDSSVERLHFPLLKQLALRHVSISEGSLHTMISNCPGLECLLLKHSFGFSCVRISSSSLRSICVGATQLTTVLQLREFIIVDAPFLERLLFFRQTRMGVAINVHIISAPKLETLGCLTDPFRGFDPYRLVFGTTTIEGLQVLKLTTLVHNVKILAVGSWSMNLDMAIDLLKCFPCLEKLYVKCCISGEMNRWRRKHKQFIKCFDIRLKTIVLEGYEGSRSQINFASFFLLNASKLELMTLQVKNRAENEAFSAHQYEVLQMEKRASRSAQLRLTTNRCRSDIHVNHVSDLVITNPFECRCWHSEAPFKKNKV